MLTEGGRLFAGYAVSTGKNSAAYLSVDGKTAVRLSENGQITIRQDGKKLKIEVSAGSVSEGDPPPGGGKNVPLTTGVRG